MSFKYQQLHRVITVLKQSNTNKLIKMFGCNFLLQPHLLSLIKHAFYFATRLTSSQPFVSIYGFFFSSNPGLCPLITWQTGCMRLGSQSRCCNKLKNINRRYEVLKYMKLEFTCDSWIYVDSSSTQMSRGWWMQRWQAAVLLTHR